MLAPGTRPLRLLHISDLHLTPGQESKKRWVAALAELEPDLVVNTGDNLAHPRAVPGVLAALDPLMSVPGVFVFGSNDYFGPRPKNPARYLGEEPAGRPRASALPWRDLRAAMIERGWTDVTHSRGPAGGRRRVGRRSPASTTPTSAWTATTGSPAARPVSRRCASA